jgi:hypothetical protein
VPRLIASVLLLSVASASLAAAQSARPTPRPTAVPKRKDGAPPRVFTNDDLEAARKKPSNVQDLSATQDGGATEGGYATGVGRAPEAPAAEPTPTPPSAEDQLRQQIAATEERLKSLDERAKQLLWQILQSTETNQILSLKADQQQVLEEIESVKLELARLRGEQPPAAPTPEPTPIPG